MLRVSWVCILEEFLLNQQPTHQNLIKSSDQENFPLQMENKLQ